LINFIQNQTQKYNKITLQKIETIHWTLQKFN